MESPAAAALIVIHLKEASEQCLVGFSQMMKGFYRIDESLGDLILDILSSKSAKSKPTVKNAAAPPALHKNAGRHLSMKELKKHRIVQFPWDPGGSILLYRLGGKPNLKERGMLGTSHGWDSHMGHGPRAQSRHWMGDYICQWSAARRASNITEPINQQVISLPRTLPSYCSSSSSRYPKILLLPPLISSYSLQFSTRLLTGVNEYKENGWIGSLEHSF